MTAGEAVPSAPAATPKGRRTQARILEAGRAVLEEKGYFETTVGEIAARSGVALGSFYHYFPNKDRLFLLLLDELVERLYSSTSGSWSKGDTRGSLVESTRRYLTTYYENRLLISALQEMAGAVPECAEMWWNLRTRVHDRMEQYLRGLPGLPRGSSRYYASALASMVEEFAHHWYVEGTRLSRELPSVDEAAEVLSTIWYRAIYEGLVRE
jgi:AcrR family transcriptional regulator